MSSSLRRGALAAALALPLASLAACGAGNDAQTLQVKPDSAATTVGDIEIQNAVVLTGSNGDGPATVSARIFNNGDVKQSLETLTVGSAQSELSATDGGQTLIVPAGGSVMIGGKGNPAATIEHSAEATKDGDFQKVTFTFSDSGAVSVQAHVVPAKGYYAPYGPSAVPSAPSTPSAASASPMRSPAGPRSPAAAHKQSASGSDGAAG